MCCHAHVKRLNLFCDCLAYCVTYCWIVVLICLCFVPTIPTQEIVFNVTWDSVLKKGLTNRKGVQELLDTTPLKDAMQEITDLLAAGTGKPADPEIYDLAQIDPDGG
jgi:hypothetical protein